MYAWQGIKALGNYEGAENMMSQPVTNATPSSGHDTKATDLLRARNDACIINTYGSRKIGMSHGAGTKIWDIEGNEYLDFFAGIAVCNLGHCHPAVTEAIAEQAARLVHVSNLYYLEPQVHLAELLTENSFADKWFFCNSGAEANETALKIARRYWTEQGENKPEIITATASFHGRTMGAITATGQPKFHEGFAPLLPGFHYVTFNDIGALEAAITPTVGAVLLEPIQGEGGIRVPDEGYWKAVRDLCDKHNILLILDEVQTGLGRTGTLFAHEDYGVTPDIMTLAKALGNGVPIGAMGCTEEVAKGFSPGSHGCTFGGNPLSTTAAVATLQTLLAPGFMGRAAEGGAYLRAKLEEIAAKCDSAIEVRGKGLMLAVEFNQPTAPLLGAMAHAGLICGPAGPNVLRLLPPLIVTHAEIDQAVTILANCLEELQW